MLLLWQSCPTALPRRYVRFTNSTFQAIHFKNGFQECHLFLSIHRFPSCALPTYLAWSGLFSPMPTTYIHVMCQGILKILTLYHFLNKTSFLPSQMSSTHNHISSPLNTWKIHSHISIFLTCKTFYYYKIIYCNYTFVPLPPN